MKTSFYVAAILLAAAWSPLLSMQKPDQLADQKAVDDQAVMEIVRTKQFELVDDQGHVRISMQMEEGNPVFKLKDENGKDRVMVFHQPDTTGVYVNDATEHTRVGLAQFPQGGGLAMHGPDGKGSAVYVLMNDGARLDAYSPDGTLTNRWPEKKEESKENK